MNIRIFGLGLAWTMKRDSIYLTCLIRLGLIYLVSTGVRRIWSSGNGERHLPGLYIVIYALEKVYKNSKLNIATINGIELHKVHPHIDLDMTEESLESKLIVLKQTKKST